MFDWYQQVYYYTPVLEFPFERKAIGRWLGVAEDCTDDMAYVILAKSGRIVVRISVWALTDDNLALPSTKEKLKTFDESTSNTLGDDINAITTTDDADIVATQGDEPAQFADKTIASIRHS
jgi:hypothetical protein